MLTAAALAVCGLVGHDTAHAQCSRPIVVPVAPTGFNVITDGSAVRGVFPDWLNALGKRIGCTFEFPVVPRARADAMVLDSRGGDVLIPASQNSERDARASFVHLRDSSVVMVTHVSQRGTVPGNLQALKKSDWRAALVRRYSFGDDYNTLVSALEHDGRVDAVNDLDTIERMLRAGRVQFTLLPAALMYAALLDGKPIDNAAEFRYHDLAGLPTGRGGAYLSASTLPPKDFELLRTALAASARDGSLRRSFEAYYPPDIVRHERFLK